MKIQSIFFNSLVIIALALGWQSCQYNACKARDIECKNGGICDLGECVCILGWEGDTCEIPVNKKFASHYSMVRTELINSTPPAFDNDDTLVFTANTLDRNKVNFFSIRDSVTKLEGHVRENALTIPEQVLAGYMYRGEGSLNGDKLTITLKKTSTDNAFISQITWVGKQYETF